MSPPWHLCGCHTTATRRKHGSRGMKETKPVPRNILFLDGGCVFCQKSARLVYRLDKRGRIHFAPLQGETAERLPEGRQPATAENDREPGAAVLAEGVDREPVYWRGADAVLRTLAIIGGFWKVFWLFRFLPRWLKNGIYRFIARNRYRIAGKTTACMIPDEGFKHRMLP